MASLVFSGLRVYALCGAGTAGITLFAITLCLNIYALYIVRKYREQYE